MSDLARQTTRAASLQTYHTIGLLVRTGRRDAAYRAYAYFRWFDDWLDGQACLATERLTFAERQRLLMERCYAGESPTPACEEERLLIDLIRSDADPHSPLAAYVRNMMRVMAFDAGRRGRVISQAELVAYQRALAVAVTEAMYYFVGGGDSAPSTPDRYLSVTAAHITHMLRDTHDDLAAGYFNIPLEFLRQHGMTPHDVDSPPYRQWVRMRVEQAREYFRLGGRYLDSARNGACRLAGQAYTARFEIVLDLIEGDGYRLRTNYGACKTFRAGLRMAGSVLRSSLGLEPIARAVDVARRDGASGIQ